MVDKEDMGSDMSRNPLSVADMQEFVEETETAWYYHYHNGRPVAWIPGSMKGDVPCTDHPEAGVIRYCDIVASVFL